MKQPREQIKSRLDKQGKLTGTKYWHCLNEEHVLGPAKNINESTLRFHLAIDHGISVKNCKTKGDLGKLHLLAHALLAHPELRELLGIGEKWEYR